MIVIDIGNKYSTILDAQNKLTLPTTILFKEGTQVKIGLKQTEPYVFYDLVIQLGVKYFQEKFNNNIKFYEFDFIRGTNDKILISIPSYHLNKAYKKMYIQTIVAIYIKELIKLFQLTYHKETNLFETHKIQLTINGSASNPCRYAFHEITSLLGIPTQLLSSSHAKMLQYYVQFKHKLKKSFKIALIDFGDQIATISIYKMYSGVEGVLEVLKVQSLQISGNDLTKMFGEYIVHCMKKQKGLDIQKYGNFMNVVQNECEYAKKNLSEEKQAFIRVPDLPDSSVFGQIVTKSFLQQMFLPEFQKAKQKIRNVLSQYPEVKNVLLTGGSCNIPLFVDLLIEELPYQFKIANLSCYGCVLAHQHEVTLLDVCPSSFKVTGEEGFKMNLISKGQPLPIRKIQYINFPAGQLEFNLKIFENESKVGIFTIENRPEDSKFNLQFEVDRNGVIGLVGSTKKGKMALRQNRLTISNQQAQKQKKMMNEYSQ